LATLAFVAICICIAVFILTSSVRPSLDLQQPLREILISNHPESELFPSISHSGKDVVFVRIAQTMDSTELVVKGIDSEDEIILIDNKGLYTNPIWSPDGQNIAYIEIGITGCRVLTISARGGPSRFVSNCSHVLVSTLRPTLAWSPDGQYLVIPMPVPDKSTHALFRVDLVTGNSQQITFPPDDNIGDASPTFSPSGDRLAFTRTSKYYTDQVVVLATKQTVNAPQTENKSVYFEQHVAPLLGITWLNHNTLLMASSQRNIYEIWSLNLSSKKRRLLGIGGHGMIHPQFNVPQQSLVMAQMKANADIAVRKFTLNAPAIIKEITSTQWERAASISNSKNLVGFIRLIPNGTELWVHNLKQNKTERLLKTDKFIAGMSWSADDQKLALSIAADLKMHIEIYERNTNRQYKLSITQTDNQQYPVWTLDGKSLVYTSESDNQWSIWKTHISDLKTVKLIQQGGNRAMLNHDESVLYFTKAGEAGFWQFALDSSDSSPSDTATLVSKTIMPNIISWDYDEGYFYYVKEMRRMVNTVYKFDPKLDSESVVYEGSPFNEMDIQGDYLTTSDIKEFSGDVFLRQYAALVK
jgi:Tol biopolymer transport system component